MPENRIKLCFPFLSLDVADRLTRPDSNHIPGFWHIHLKNLSPKKDFFFVLERENEWYQEKKQKR